MNLLEGQQKVAKSRYKIVAVFHGVHVDEVRDLVDAHVRHLADAGFHVTLTASLEPSIELASDREKLIP